jgi:hypothetical protein
MRSGQSAERIETKMKNCFSRWHHGAIAAAVIALAAIAISGCSSHKSAAYNGSYVNNINEAQTPQGGMTIATSAGQAVIPPQVAKLPGFEPPNQYMAAMIARDQARDAQNKH